MSTMESVSWRSGGPLTNVANQSHVPSMYKVRVFSLFALAENVSLIKARGDLAAPIASGTADLQTAFSIGETTRLSGKRPRLIGKFRWRSLVRPGDYLRSCLRPDQPLYHHLHPTSCTH